MVQIFSTQSVTDALEPGHQYLAHRSVSDMDDPDLGAASMDEDDATGEGGGDKRNAQEAREEREKAEVAKAAQAEADAAAKTQADAAARVQADAVAKAQAEEASCSLAPELVVPLRAEPPAPGGTCTGWRGWRQPDYHNIRAAAFNSHVQELAKRTTNMTDSRRAAAELQQRLGETQTKLRTKEEERSKAAQEVDRLTKELAD
nr:translation initiation factor IF-2-like [Aegilops tauschii subsp. strangulata]